MTVLDQIYSSCLAQSFLRYVNHPTINATDCFSVEYRKKFLFLSISGERIIVKILMKGWILINS